MGDPWMRASIIIKSGSKKTEPFWPSEERPYMPILCGVGRDPHFIWRNALPYLTYMARDRWHWSIRDPIPRYAVNSFPIAIP